MPAFTDDYHGDQACNRCHGEGEYQMDPVNDNTSEIWRVEYGAVTSPVGHCGQLMGEGSETVLPRLPVNEDVQTLEESHSAHLPQQGHSDPYLSNTQIPWRNSLQDISLPSSLHHPSALNDANRTSMSAPWRRSLSSKTYLTTALLLLWLLLGLQPAAGAQEEVVYPPLFNAAKGGTVAIIPPDNECGRWNDATFCKSTADASTLTSCWEAGCTYNCPHADDRYHELAFSRVNEGWGDCVSKHFDALAPAPAGAEVESYRVRFQGTGNGTCYLDLPPDWMAVLFLQAVRSVTLAMWIRPMENTVDNTLFVIGTSDSRSVLRLGMTSKYQLLITSHNQPLTTRSQWKLQVNVWTHLVLRIRHDTVSIAFNGSYVSPSAYGVSFLSVREAAKYRVGANHGSNDFFKGDLQDFRIYVKSVSNREVREIYTGSLPPTRIQTNCRCPDDHPALKPSDHTYCVSNNGTNMPTSELYRLDRNTYPLEFLNDGKSDSAWVGKVGVVETSITINMKMQFEVLAVVIHFYSSLPDKMIVERRENMTKAWTPWQYYSQDCPTKFSLPQDGPISTEHAVNCRPMATTATVPASDGKVTFDVLEGRPGRNGTSLTYALRQFLQADAVRLTLTGYPFSQLERKAYHGLYEVTVNARCNCHGHGTACDTSGPEYVCTCAPQSYTRGRQCDQCVDGTYRDTTKTDYSANVCKPCDCHVDGTLGGSTVCENRGGQCSCKKNVGRRRCDTCLPGYHGLQPSDPDGCRECSCDLRGTLQGSNICDVITGWCPCKPHVAGMRCDQCEAGFYNLDPEGPDGCQACGCDPTGVLAGNLNCEQTTGKCQCRPGVTGRRCDSCEEGYYTTNNTKGDACRACACDPVGSEGTSCDRNSGQCICRPNVIGRSCDRCKPGYFAENEADMSDQGCSRLCTCSENGTLLESDGSCEKYGGQCPCKNNTAGRKCDACRDNSFGFNTSPTLGCTSCDCDVRGTRNSGRSCDVTTGQCPCKENVQSRRCDVCKGGTYGLEESVVTGCLPCACYMPATQPGLTCNPLTGRCMCIEAAGDPAITGYKCEPYITGMVPTFGPESGGTRLELRGGFLGNAAETTIKVGSLDCPVSQTEGNQTTIVCATKTLRDSRDDQEKKGSNLKVTLNVQTLETASPDSFVYLEDPTIRTISPTTTFLQGGLELTVTGEHLNSVYRPLMQVTMQGPSTKTVFSSVCSVDVPAIMYCRTPNISVPDGMLDDQARRRRSIGNHGYNPDIHDVINSGNPHVDTIRHSRVKRQEEDGKPINRPSLEFYLGFILDGITIYKDLRDSIPEFAVLQVYLNPAIKRFQFEDGIMMYRPYWPYSHSLVSIQGSRLDYAATPTDYKVEIGKGLCEEVTLSHNLLTCRPPAREPDQEPEHGLELGLPAVVVTVGNIRINVGWMDYEHNFWENLQFRYGVLGGVAALLLFIILICCCCCCRRCRRQPAEKPHPHLELSGKGSTNNAYISAYNGSQTSYMSPTMELLSLLPDRLRGRVETTLIDYKRMEVGKLIGQGHFGRIYLGRLSSEDHSTQMPIAIKTLREYHVTPRDVAYFLDEATIMKDLKHEHVLHLLGVVIENNRSYVLLPYMENGDLKSFISNEDNLLTVGELINFGQQVADGMCYLSDQKFVHRDLAARNCMVDRNLVVKIADFGLSRELYESDYYREGESARPLPVKWMSFESLERGVFTSLSDVWSFGVLLWELMTRGCTPYPDVDSFDMKVYITSGNRMDKPDFAPHELYELMILCWQKEPTSRPNFYEIHTRLGEILEGQNVTNTMRNNQVRPLSYGGAHNHGYTDITREMDMY